jgi:hypothetical protein
MERSLNPVKLGDESDLVGGHGGHKCGGCHDEFERPLLATVSSCGSVQKYYACPRCLSKVEDARHEGHEERIREKSSVSLEAVKKAFEAKQSDEVKCRHSLGYLKKRGKDMPIPDECLTCDKMIECLIR